MQAIAYKKVAHRTKTGLQGWLRRSIQTCSNSVCLSLDIFPKDLKLWAAGTIAGSAKSPRSSDSHKKETLQIACSTCLWPPNLRPSRSTSWPVQTRTRCSWPQTPSYVMTHGVAKQEPSDGIWTYTSVLRTLSIMVPLVVVKQIRADITGWPHDTDAGCLPNLPQDIQNGFQTCSLHHWN